MNTRAILPAVFAALVLAVVSWREHSLQDNIDALRKELATLPRAPSMAAPIAPVVPPTSSREDATDFHDELAKLEARIAELEAASNDAARIINKQLDEKEARERAVPKRSWSAAQATSAPDTANIGDHATAWAPAAQDGGEEWLDLAYDAPVEVAQVIVRETYNPGAISKVSVILENGAEVPIWQGMQQAVPGPIDRAFPVPAGMVASRVKVYLDTKRVPGWNEIDAVALTDRSGTRHWATGATASSSYGASIEEYDSLLGGETNLRFESLSRSVR